MESHAKNVEERKWSLLQTVQEGGSLAPLAGTGEGMPVGVRKKKWVARLINNEGTLYKAISMSWKVPPSTVPAFIIKHEAWIRWPDQWMGPKPTRFVRGKMLRSDSRITIIEYREEA